MFQFALMVLSRDVMHYAHLKKEGKAFELRYEKIFKLKSTLQVVVIFSVLSLFLYFIVYAFTLPETGQAPDYSWLKV